MPCAESAHQVARVTLRNHQPQEVRELEHSERPTQPRNKSFFAHSVKMVNRIPRQVLTIRECHYSSEDITASSCPDSFMVLDTGCERMCGGPAWLDAHFVRLSTLGYQVCTRAENENFTFGDDAAYQSKSRHVFPAATAGGCYLVRS